MNIYLNNNSYSHNDYDDLVKVSGLTYDQINDALYKDKFKDYMNVKVFEPVFNTYPDVCKMNVE
jgi:hypothetical protein